MRDKDEKDDAGEEVETEEYTFAMTASSGNRGVTKRWGCVRGSKYPNTHKNPPHTDSIAGMEVTHDVISSLATSDLVVESSCGTRISKDELHASSSMTDL